MLKEILIISGCILFIISQDLVAQDVVDPDKDLLYVTDRLRLSLYEKASEQSRTIKLLSSGDRLAVEEISGSYALVTTSKGSKGWVKKGFLVEKPTSNLLLKQEQEKNKDLEVELEKLANSKRIVDQYENDMNTMTVKIDALQAENNMAAETIAALELELEPEVTEEDSGEGQEARNPPLEILWQTALVYWKIIAPMFLGIIILTFYVSKEIVETRIKSRFHGIKIW